jgi:hypothetical protein
MQLLKGKANPSLNKTGQLRYDFLAPNRCLSLMHSSDNLSQVRREGAVFFCVDRLARACEGAGRAAANTPALMDELAQASSELGIEHVEEPGLGTLFARVRLRLMKELQRAPTTVPLWPAIASSYRELWVPLSVERTRRPVIAEAHQYLQHVARERPLLEALTAALGSTVTDRCEYAQYYRPATVEPMCVLRSLQVLSNPEAYSKWDSNRQLPECVLHDRWERLLFHTHLFNFDDMLSRSGVGS